MPLKPRSSKGTKRARTSSTVAQVAGGLQRLGENLLALQDRKAALEREEQLLEIRKATEERLQREVENTEHARSIAEQSAFVKQMFAEKADKRAQEKHDFMLAGGGQKPENLSVAEQREADYLSLLDKGVQGNPIAEIAGGILRNMKVQPGQVGFAEAFRKEAENVLIRAPQFAPDGTPLTGSRGQPLYHDGVLSDFASDKQPVLLEKTIEWMLKNASALGTPLPPGMKEEILGTAPRTVPPAAAIDQLGEDPSDKDKAALAGSLSEQNRRLRQQAGSTPGQTAGTSFEDFE